MSNEIWPDSWISGCLGCGSHLAVSAVPFSGDIQCPSCGALNSFRNTQQPLSVYGQTTPPSSKKAPPEGSRVELVPALSR